MASELQDIQLTEAKPLLVENVPTPVPVIPETAEGEVSAETFIDVESKEHDIQTGYGLLHVTVRGSGKGNRPAILTYHDIGLNHKSCFNALFNYEDMQEIIKNFAVYHIDAPGQQPGAPLFPQGYQYPSMDQLADMLPGVMTHFSLKSIIGIGVGAGSYVLARMAMNNPSLVEGLVLINIEPHAKGWFDWAASKITNLTNTLTDTVLSHHFSQSELSNNADLMQTYKQHMLEEINQQNLSLFVNAYNSRRDLDLGKASLGQPAKTLKCPVMLVVGDSSPMVDAVVSGHLGGDVHGRRLARRSAGSLHPGLLGVLSLLLMSRSRSRSPPPPPFPPRRVDSASWSIMLHHARQCVRWSSRHPGPVEMSISPPMLAAVENRPRVAGFAPQSANHRATALA
nr:protein NDRG3-like isoform X2 [Petromyzon marinus]